MKYILLIVTLLLSTVANADERYWTELEGTWHPSGQILSTMQMHLESHMKSQGKVLKASLKKWDTYRFQYQGQEGKGRKFVSINAACHLSRPKGEKLSKEIASVSDAGSCFFQLKYDPIADKFFDVIINNEK